MTEPRKKRNPKAVLVTGACGFIGSHFITEALRRGMEVVAADKLTYASDNRNYHMAVQRAESLGVRNARQKAVFKVMDICDHDAVYSAMSVADAVVNFAAESHVDRSIANPLYFMKTNVEGAANILTCARELGWGKRNKRVVLQVSTDEVYGSIAEGSFTESSPRSPRNPYAVTKAAAEMMCEAFRNTWGVPYIITRGSNTFGPRQYPEKIIPIFATRLLRGLKVSLFKGGEHNVRDWLHAEDHCSGIAQALTHGEVGEAYNVAGSCERTNMELARVVIGSLGLDFKERLGFIPDRPGHDYRYSIDAAKLRGIGWCPRHGEWDWEEAVSDAVRWYRDNERWWTEKVQW